MGLDLSTQGLKLVVIGEEEREVIYEDSLVFDEDLSAYDTEMGVTKGLPSGFSESPPAMWRDALFMILERIKGKIDTGSIRAISIGGQQHGLVAIDEEGNLTRERAKLWNDYSTADEAEQLTNLIGGKGAVMAEVANTMRPGYTAPKILHMKAHEPELYEKTATFLLPHNYLNFVLTGKRVMEYGDASGTALWDPVNRRWSRKLVEAISSDLWEKLPEVLEPDVSIGTIQPSLAERFGLTPDCLIDAGSGDNMYGAIGTGNVRPGIFTISLGTSGTGYTILERPFVDEQGEIACFCDSTGYYLSLICVSNLAGAYERLRDAFDLSHEEFEELASSSLPGEGGKLVLPWFEGERTPDLPQARSIFFGFAPGDFNPRVLCRAIVDGVLLNMADGCQRIPAKAKEIRLTGGLSRSLIWRQAIADIFETPVVPVLGEGVALGAAIHAYWVWSRENFQLVELEDLCRAFVKLSEGERAFPRGDMVERYRTLRRCFGALSKRVRGLPSPDDPFALSQTLL